MVDTLTESFCERCGTRYEFKAPTRLNPLRKTRGFIGGLKNYLTSQDALADAMGDAMRSEEDQLAAAQLEAFHESFNFCINCRQYTCVNCWNDDEGRCRTCAPIPGTDDLGERLAASFAGNGTAAVSSPPPSIAGAPSVAVDDIQPRPGLDAWPSSDVPPLAASNGHELGEWPEAEGLGWTGTPADVSDPLVDAPAADAVAPELQPVTELEHEPEPVAAEDAPEPLVDALEAEPERVAAEDAPEPLVDALEAEPAPIAAELEHEPIAAELEHEPIAAELEREPIAAELEPEPVAAEAEPEPRSPLIRVVGWDEDATSEVPTSTVEPADGIAGPEPAPDPVAAETEPEVEPVAADIAAEPEPSAEVVVEGAPEPEPERRAPRIAPISETILRFPAATAPPPDQPPAERVAAEDESPELAARRAQLELLGLGDPGEGPVTERPAVLPYRSRGAAVTPAEIAARAATGGFWEASAREVAAGAAMAVQNCGDCGLSLSANARFCRRCGARQAKSA